MKIIGIMILFKDHSDKILSKISRFAEVVDSLYLVDNSNSSFNYLFEKNSKIIYTPLYENKGIAFAQNVALKYALDSNFDFVLFADPDTSIPEMTLLSMINKYNELKANGYPVGGIGSTAVSEDTGLPYHIDDCFISKIDDFNVTEVTYTMNSVSLIPLYLFKKVGLMDESLFIDGVDDEWCWRASKIAGVRFFLANNVIVKHNLGKIWGKIGNRNISVASPQRLFFEYRNFIWLKKRSYVPIQWVKYNRKKYYLKILFYCLFVSPRLQNFKFIIKGIVAGYKHSTVPQ